MLEAGTYSLDRQWPLWARLASAVCLAVAACVASLSLDLLQAGYPFLLLYPAVIVSAYLFGRDAGLAATATGAILAGALLYALSSEDPWQDAYDALAVMLFIAAGMISSLLLSRLKCALRALEVAHQELAKAHCRTLEAEQEKDMLLRELAHRIRNDLGSISSILKLQARTLDGEAAVAVESAADRVQVLARVHKRLSRQGHEAVVDMKKFLTDLCSDLQTSHLTMRPIALVADVAPVELPAARAVSVGLIVNELLTNALKYAFPNGRRGTVRVSLQTKGGRTELTVDDDGIGSSGNKVLPEQSGGTGLGQRLVASLAAQLGGRFACDAGSTGTTCRIDFPI